MLFDWSHIQRRTDGKILLLYRHERLFSEPFIPTVRDVLDVGGWGVLAQRFIEEGMTCTILDLFTRDQMYPDRVRSLPHKVGDVRDIDCFPAASFDLVTCFETLEHCGDATKAMCSIHRWLRPNGWLVGTVPIDGFCHFTDEPGIDVIEADLLRSMLTHNGFSDILAEPTGSISPSDEPCCIYFRGRKS